MTKSIEEQASEKYPHTVVVRSGLELRDSLKNREFREVYIDAAKSRDEQWSAVVNELREFKFKSMHFPTLTTNNEAVDMANRIMNELLTKADQMLREMGVSL